MTVFDASLLPDRVYGQVPAFGIRVHQHWRIRSGGRFLAERRNGAEEPTAIAHQSDAEVP